MTAKDITLTDLWLMPQERRDGVTDSLLQESDTPVASARCGDREVEIRTQGYVTIVWDGETYTLRQDFPDDLVEAIRNNRIYSSGRGQVDENNWYEIMAWEGDRLLRSDVIDLDDLSTLTEDECREILADFLLGSIS